MGSRLEHHYVICVRFKDSSMTEELRFHSPTRAREAFVFYKEHPEVKSLRSSSLGMTFTRP